MNWRPRISCLLLFGLPLFLVTSLGITKAQIKPLSFTDKDGQRVIVYSESHALVIWAGAYQPQHWARLANIKSEAEDVSAALIRQGFTITTVSNPTGRQLREKIQEFINNHGYAKRNRLVIYFAGHGFSPYPYRKGYLVPVDAPDPAADPQTEQAFLKVALDMDQIVSWAKQMQAKHVLFVFDSCFAGTIFKQRSASPSSLYIESIMNKPVRQFLTAGYADQEVPAKSFFSPLFIRGIEGEADLSKDGYVTGSELGLYLRQNLGSYTKLQTPQFGTIRDPDLDQGDIIFLALNAPSNSQIARNGAATNQSRMQSGGAPSPELPSVAAQKNSDSVEPSSAQTPPVSTQRLWQDPLIRRFFNLPPSPKSETALMVSKSIDYRRLQDFLAKGKWKEADQETSDLLLKLSNRKREGWLRQDDIKNLSCEGLRKIDRYWVAHSKGKFGFSIQRRIFRSLGGTTEANHEVDDKFGDMVGWRRDGVWKYSSDIALEKAKPGFLPVLGWGDLNEPNGLRCKGSGAWFYECMWDLASLQNCSI